MNTQKSFSQHFSKSYLFASLLVVFFVFFAFSISACKDDDSMSTPEVEQPGNTDNTLTTAPAFTLSTTMGSQVSLSDHANKVRVLFFFGNQCPSCKAAAPSIESTLVTPYAKRTDYIVIGLDQWNGNQSVVDAFKTSTGVSFSLLMNAATVATSYGTTYDRLVVIHKNGKIAFKGTQGASSDLTAAHNKVKSLLGL